MIGYANLSKSNNKKIADGIRVSASLEKLKTVPSADGVPGRGVIESVRTFVIPTSPETTGQLSITDFVTFKGRQYAVANMIEGVRKTTILGVRTNKL